LVILVLALEALVILVLALGVLSQMVALGGLGLAVFEVLQEELYLFSG
jgi:hypothetical protein